MSTPSRSGFRGAAAVASLAFAAASAAAADTFADPLAVTVHSERYVVGGQAVDDLDRLEAAVQALAPRSIRLQVCEMPATRAFKAAMHRFRALPLKTLVLPADHTDCRAPAAPMALRVSDRPDRLPSGIDDEAVERWWGSLMP